MSLIHLIGAKGVGKTTVIQELKNSNPKIQAITASSLVRETAKDNYGKKWSHLDSAERRKIRDTVLNKLFSLKDSGTIILDSHLVDIDPEGNVTNIFPPEFESLIDHTIVLEAAPSTILGRREGDTSRERQKDMSNIKKEQEAELGIALDIARRTGTSITRIDTEGKNPIQVANDLLREINIGRKEGEPLEEIPIA